MSEHPEHNPYKAPDTFQFNPKLATEAPTFDEIQDWQAKHGLNEHAVAQLLGLKRSSARSVLGGYTKLNGIRWTLAMVATGELTPKQLVDELRSRAVS